MNFKMLIKNSLMIINIFFFFFLFLLCHADFQILETFKKTNLTIQKKGESNNNESVVWLELVIILNICNDK